MINSKQIINSKIFIKNYFINLIFALFSVFFLSSCADNPFSSKEKKSADTVNVAVLLPISGQESEYYKELNKMVKLGLSDGAKRRIKVSSYDSSTKRTLSESIEKIISNNTDIIIGPVFSEAAEATAAKLKDRNINIVTLSNNPVIADNNLFVFGHAPMRQIEFLVNNLLSNGYNNYIMLLPAGRYSQSVSSILREMIISNNATLIRIEYYNSNDEEDIARAVKLISDNVDSINEMDYNLTQPVILLADDDGSLRKVFGYAKRYNLDSKAVLAGDGRIDIQLNNAMDITFTGSNYINSVNISEKAAKVGIKHLSFMHNLAYDAGRIVAENITNNYDNKNFIDAMQEVKFQGVSGNNIHFVDSIAQRQYDVLRRKNNKLMLLANAINQEQKTDSGAEINEVSGQIDNAQKVGSMTESAK